MIWDKDIDEIAYKKLKKVVSNIIYRDKQDFHKQAKKLSNELWKLSWGQINLLTEAVHIIIEKFNELEEENENKNSY